MMPSSKEGGFFMLRAIFFSLLLIISIEDSKAQLDWKGKVGRSWDISLEVAKRTPLQKEFEEDYLLGFFIGGLWVNDPSFLSLGLMSNQNFKGLWTFSPRLQYVHLITGLWTQLGTLSDTEGNTGLLVAAGISIFGIEYNWRAKEKSLGRSALLLKLQVPLGILNYGLNRQ
jgi:hypothetical protein